MQLLTYALFRDVPEVKAKWQEKFSLIFVDEYQDTDPVQYGIIKTLAEKHQNLRVVGDDDQGIYRWRGADIQNILNFEKDYPNPKVIPLGKNYRSTQKIVEISRALVDFNLDRREKELFTKNFEGESVKHLHCENDEEEASTIATFVHRSIDQGGRLPSDFAVLYRTNKQAHAFKNAFNDLGIRYHIVRDSSDTDTSGVSMMTIHKSKGLEFPNVFVVGICQELLPHYYNRDEKNWDEEIRLLYVAMTRAENWLCLSSYDYDKYQRGQSPFLERGYISPSLLESVETLENTPIPPAPETMIAPKERFDSIEPLPEKLLGSGMTVIGVDPGNIGARETNVGWSVTRKVLDGYAVLDHGTQCPTGTKKDKLEQIKDRINSLVELFSPDAIAVEKFEVATEDAKADWFYHVAGCVATVRSIAHQHGIECHLYTPQQVKYIATHNPNASKLEVQKGVLQICNLQQIPEPHHSADAIAASLCYLRSYLNSYRFEGNKRKQEHYEMGRDYLNKKQYETAIDTFKETINIDPVYTDAHCGLGRAYLAQGNLEAAENAARKSLKLAENDHPNSKKLLDDIKMRYYYNGKIYFNHKQYNQASFEFQQAIEIDQDFKGAHLGLGKVYFKLEDLEKAEKSTREALRIAPNYELAQELLQKIKQKHKEHGDNYRNRKAYTEALKSYQHAIRIDEKYKEVYNNLGIVYRNMREYDKSITAYQKAIDIDERCQVTHHNLSIVYRKIGEYANAVNSLKRAIAIKPDCQTAYYNLARTYFETENLQDASETVKAALTLDSNYQPAHKLLDDIKQAYYDQGCDHLDNQRYNEAIAAFNQVINRDSNFIDAYCGLSKAYLGQRNLDAARESANAALRIDENCRPARELLRELLIDIQICSLQIDDQETRVDRELRDRGPRSRGRNSGAFQRLWSAILNRLRHH